MIEMSDIYSNSGDVVSVDLDTLEATLVYPGDKYDIGRIYYLDADVLVFYGYNIAAAVEESATHAIVEVVRYDFGTGETTIFWSHGRQE